MQMVHVVKTNDVVSFNCVTGGVSAEGSCQDGNGSLLGTNRERKKERERE